MKDNGYLEELNIDELWSEFFMEESFDPDNAVLDVIIEMIIKKERRNVWEYVLIIDGETGIKTYTYIHPNIFTRFICKFLLGWEWKRVDKENNE